MRFVGVREFKANPSDSRRLAGKVETVVVASRGKPTAVPRAITEDGLEDYVLENSARIKRMVSEGERAIADVDRVLLRDHLQVTQDVASRAPDPLPPRPGVKKLKGYRPPLAITAARTTRSQTTRRRHSGSARAGRDQSPTGSISPAGRRLGKGDYRTG